MIWTTEGNLPESALEYSHEWRDEPQAMVFSETYRLKGVVVKQSCHARLKEGLIMTGTQETL